jgi:hypothetical protein
MESAMPAVVAEKPLSVEAFHSLWWCDHFHRNAGRQLAIRWDAAVPLTDDQRVLLPSLQDFQLGESSEGHHGRARAAAYADRVGDPHYAEAIRLFFAEENRHAGYLARYLHGHGVEPIGRSWTDFVFRRVRRLMGLDLLLTVLLTAELIGEVYYRAVRDATRCPVLRAVCTQLLRDERMHVRFHVERFRFLRAGRSRARIRIQDRLWRVFFAVTCLAVWVKHGRAMRLGGYGFRRFRREAAGRWAAAVRAANEPPCPAASYNVNPDCVTTGPTEGLTP